MNRRSTGWLVAAVIYTLVNAGGALYAARMGELLHCALHVVLLAPAVWFFLWRRDRSPAAAAPAETGLSADRLTNLEQSIDAVALEVERIGESQRFMTRLFTEKRAEKDRSEE